jgi:hypothetical protein
VKGYGARYGISKKRVAKTALRPSPLNGKPLRFSNQDQDSKSQIPIRGGLYKSFVAERQGAACVTRCTFAIPSGSVKGVLEPQHECPIHIHSSRGFIRFCPCPQGHLHRERPRLTRRRGILRRLHRRGGRPYSSYRLVLARRQTRNSERANICPA